jgi:hypothetical protein
MKTFFIALRGMLYQIGAVVFWGWLALRVRPTDNDLGIENIQREIPPQKRLAPLSLTIIRGFRNPSSPLSS